MLISYWLEQRGTERLPAAFQLWVKCCEELNWLPSQLHGQLENQILPSIDL